MSEKPATKSNPRPAFSVVLAAGFMTLLDVSIVNVALPSIESSLRANPAHLQWIVAGYALSLGLSMVPAGRIGDVLGHRRVLVAGVAGFAGASLLCGLSVNATMLAICRIVQGVAGGMINPQMAGYVQILFEKRFQPRAFAAIGTMIGVSTAIGPTLGGLIIAAGGAQYGWRAIFLINLPMALVVIPMAMKFLPSSHQTGSRYRSQTSEATASDSAPKPATEVGVTRPQTPAEASEKPKPETGSGAKINLDGGGLVLIAITVLLIMWPFITTGKGNLAEAPWWMLGVAALSLTAFALWEHWRGTRGKAVILPKEVLKNPSYMLGALVGMAFFMGQSGYFLTFTLYLQQGLGLPAWVAGLMQAPLAIASAIGSARSGRLVQKYGRGLVIFGQFGVGIGVVLLLVATAVDRLTPAVLILIAATFILGYSRGLTISPNQALSLSEVPAEVGATAAGLLQTMQRIGSTIGIAAMTMLFFNSLISAGVSGAHLDKYTRPELLDAYGNAFSSALHLTVAALVLSTILAVVDWARRHKKAEDTTKKFQN